MAALFTTGRAWKQPKCLSVGEWIRIVQHTLKYYITMKMKTFQLYMTTSMNLTQT